MPQALLVPIKRQIFSFLWGSNHELIRRETLIGPSSKGGLGMVDIESKIDSFRIHHLSFVINETNHSKWIYFTKYWVGLQLREFNPALWSNLTPHSTSYVSKFYGNCLTALGRFKVAMGRDEIYWSTIASRNVYDVLVDRKLVPPRTNPEMASIDLVKVWKSIHSKFISPDLRDLYFRIAHNILPVQSRLYHCKVSTSLACACCGGNENLTHCFFDCPVIQPVILYIEGVINIICSKTKFAVDKNVHLSNLKYSFLCLQFDELSGDTGSVVALLVATTTKALWHQRCEEKYEKVPFDANSVISKVWRSFRHRMLVDFKRWPLEKFRANWVLSGAAVFDESEEAEPSLTFRDL